MIWCYKCIMCKIIFPFLLVITNRYGRSKQLTWIKYVVILRCLEVVPHLANKTEMTKTKEKKSYCRLKIWTQHPPTRLLNNEHLRSILFKYSNWIQKRYDIHSCICESRQDKMSLLECYFQYTYIYEICSAI